MAGKTYKLDLFGLFGRIDKKDYQLWNKYNDDEKKEISPLIIMRWMSGTSDKRQIIFLNELVNQLVFALGNHKDLLLKLLAVASSGVSRRYFWLSMKPTAEKHGAKRALEAVETYYQCSSKEAREYLKLLEKEDVIEICEAIGLQKEEIQLVKREYS